LVKILAKFIFGHITKSFFTYIVALVAESKESMIEKCTSDQQYQNDYIGNYIIGINDCIYNSIGRFKEMIAIGCCRTV
jgi:hypothetical protein